MAKYYVSSGSIRVVQQADDAFEAMVKALQRAFEDGEDSGEEMSLGMLFCANEIGFDSPCLGPDCKKEDCEDCKVTDEECSSNGTDCVFCMACPHKEPTDNEIISMSAKVIEKAGLIEFFFPGQSMEEIVEDMINKAKEIDRDLDLDEE